MKIAVRLFAVARQLAGREVMHVELPDGSTVAQLREQLAAEVPALRGVLPQMLVAVGSEYARDNTVIVEGREVACIPPVSGG